MDHRAAPDDCLFLLLLEEGHRHDAHAEPLGGDELLVLADLGDGGIVALDADDPLALSRVTILLPTRRACRTLAEAFLQHCESGALLLPRIGPLGDLDEDEVGFGASAVAEGGDLPPELPSLRRQFLLAKLILAREADGHIDQALRLAQELGGFLDQAQNEQLDLAGLNNLAPERHAAHWQKVLDFLKIL